MILVREQLKGIADGGTIQPASIDLTASREWYTMRDYSYRGNPHELELERREQWEKRYTGEAIGHLCPGEFVLVDTNETITMPEDCAGFIQPRSSLFRMGVQLLGGFVDPGFKGKITFGLKNVSSIPVWVNPGERVCQLVVHRCEQAPKQTYDGHYQEK